MRRTKVAGLRRNVAVALRERRGRTESFRAGQNRLAGDAAALRTARII